MRPSLTLGLTALLSSGCQVGPDYRPPDFERHTGAPWRQIPDAVTDQSRDELARWWERLGSPELDALARQLLAQNLSLAEARQRVVGAMARRGIADADRLPQVGAEAGYFLAGTGERSLNFQGPPPGEDLDVYNAGLTAGWELDLWGRVARLVEAADAEIELTIEDYRDAAVSLLAELALAYVDAHVVERRLAVAGRIVELQRETVRLARSRFEAGSGGRLDLEQAERELAASRARLPELAQARRAAENRIATLVGERPRDALVRADAPLTLPESLGLGLPADLLTRRADLRGRERRLAAAVARIGATEAERYPRITISGTLALRAQDFDTLFEGADALSYSVGPGLSLPLFTGGRIDSAVALREAEAEAARLAYEQSLLAAIAEVETSAHGVARSRDAVGHLEAAAEAARRSVALADELYAAGSRSLLQVVDAQRSLAAAEDRLLLGRQTALAATIGLYRALGGGFEPLGAGDALLPATGAGVDS
jgi:NodT family efflux transporter outer membrane factor (OMF) lipoprotein